MPTLLAVLVSYLIGSIPTGDIAGRLRGVDIRKLGSGNPGFTNVLRTLGPATAVPVLVVDVLKGVVAVLVLASMPGAAETLGPVGIRLASGLAAVIGSIWPVFARFRGGRGVAVACGLFLAMAPLATLAAVVLWLAVVLTSGYVSLGSISAAVFLPWAVWLEGRLPHAPERPAALIVAAAAVAAAVVIRHRANIGRLIKGTENRFGRRSRQGGQR